MLEFVRKWWCRTFHEKVMRPICGNYRCAECLREWPVNWGVEVPTAPAMGCSEIAPTNAHLSLPHILA